MLPNDDLQDGFAPAGMVLAQAGLPGETSAIWLVHQHRALPLRKWAEQWPCAGFASITDLVREWTSHHAGLRRLTELPRTAEAIALDGLPAASLQLEAPLQPTQLFCTIGNYKRQVIEAAATPPSRRWSSGAARERPISA